MYLRSDARPAVSRDRDPQALVSRATGGESATGESKRSREQRPRRPLVAALHGSVPALIQRAREVTTAGA